MSLNQSPKPMICEEVFDDRSQPSEDEVREFAVQIGIDPDVERHLLPLARDGLMKPLPKHWKPVYDHKLGRFYYFNFKTRQSTWEHPLDSKFRHLVKKSRSESLSSAGEEDSKTSVKEDLKSFEEIVGDSFDSHEYIKDNEMIPSSQWKRPTSAHGPRGTNSVASIHPSTQYTPKKNDLEPFYFHPESNSSIPQVFPNTHSINSKVGKHGEKQLSSENTNLAQNLKNDVIVNNLVMIDAPGSKKKGVSFNSSSQLGGESSSPSLTSRFSVERVFKIDIEKRLKRLDHEQEENAYKSEKNMKRGPTQEFTVTGGGSIFLKSNQKSSPSKSDAELESKNSNVNAACSDINTDLHSIHNLTSIFREEESNFQDSTLPVAQENEITATNSQSFPSSTLSTMRGILRPLSGDKLLWDMEPQTMTNFQKSLWKQQELEEEKKSVRFNLDQELNISFKGLDSLDSENEEELVEEVEWNSNEDKSSTEKNYDLEGERLPPTTAASKDKGMHLGSPWNISYERSIISEVKCEIKDEILDSKPALIIGPAHSDTDANIIESKNNIRLEELADYAADTTPSKAEIKDLDKEVLVTSSSNMASKFNKSIDVLLHQPSISSFSRDVFSKESASSASLEECYIPQRNPYIQENTTTNVGNIPPSNEFRSESNQDPASISSGNKVMGGSTAQSSKSLVLTESSNQHLPQEKKMTIVNAFNNVIQNDDNVLISDTVAHRYPILQEETHYLKSTEDNKVLDSKKDPSTTQPEEEIVFPGSHTIFENHGVFERLMVALESRFKDQLERLSKDYMNRVDMKEKEFEFELEKKERTLVEKYQRDLVTHQELWEKKEKELREIASRLESEYETRIHQSKEQLEHKQNCALQEIKEMHQQALAAQEVENQASLLRLREQHALKMKMLHHELLKEEEDVRKAHIERILNIEEDKSCKPNREANEQLRINEKLRRDKHLLENKYRTLKEKYVKLKTEMTVNSRKKDENPPKSDQINNGSQLQQNNVQPIIEHNSLSSQTQIHLPSDRPSESMEKTTTSTLTSQDKGPPSSIRAHKHQNQSNSSDPVISSALGSVGCPKASDECCKRHPFTEASLLNQIKSPQGIPATNANSSIQKEEKSGNAKNDLVPQASSSGEPHNLSEVASQSLQNKTEPSPMEALRHQLQTLDELEEQFPPSSLTDTYLRYPFSDLGKHELKSAELEFFRHRIHLERNMIKRAKGCLQVQQGVYHTRVQDYLRKQSSSPPQPHTTLHQMSQEEKELSDLEGSLKKTQTLLSEKITHLRNLEKSFQNFSLAVFSSCKEQTKPINNLSEKSSKSSFNRRWDWKAVGAQNMNDDISSDSGGSSGFSSSDYTLGSKQASIQSYLDVGNNKNMKDSKSSHVNACISNLNVEINEILNVLCERRTQAGLEPPPFLKVQHHRFKLRDSNTLSAPSVSGFTPHSNQSLPETSTIMERSNSLRHWLQNIKVDASLPHSLEH